MIEGYTQQTARERQREKERRVRKLTPAPPVHAPRKDREKRIRWQVKRCNRLAVKQNTSCAIGSRWAPVDAVVAESLVNLHR